MGLTGLADYGTMPLAIDTDPEGNTVNILTPATEKAVNRVARENRDAFRCERCADGPRCERCAFLLDVELPLDVADMMEELYG